MTGKERLDCHLASQIEPQKAVVLIVEDEPLLLMMAVALVEDSGFEAIEAKDADEAVAILTQREDIRILFTDIDMPGSMDGIGLARKVRECRPDVEIIIVSGRVRPGSNVLPARSMFFSKPYNTGQVAQQLHRMASNDEP